MGALLPGANPGVLGLILAVAACGGSATHDERAPGGPSSTGSGGVGAAPVQGGASGAEEPAEVNGQGGPGSPGGGAEAAGAEPGRGGAAPRGGGGAEAGSAGLGGTPAGVAVMSGGGAEAGSAGLGGKPAGGAEAGGAAGAASVGYCPGIDPDPATSTRTRCTTHADCPTLAVLTRCATEPFTFACGGPAPVRTCAVDGDCAAEAICEEDACGSTWCVRGCPDLPCLGTETCVEKRCVERPCDGEGAAACPDRHSCRPEEPGADARGCVPDACAAGATCPEGWDCAPGTAADVHGCVHRTCSAAADCDCGSCVNGLCEASPGFCFEYSPPV